MNNVKVGPRTTVLAVLVYVERDGKILMLHRNARENDDHKGKWNGLGGKLEAGESMLECAVRETHEESGVRLPAEWFKPLGTLHFPLFKPHKNEDWLVFVFKAAVPKDRASSLPFWEKCDEGELHWIDRDQVLGLNLWEGDRYFIPRVLAGEKFMGTFFYENSALVNHWIA